MQLSFTELRSLSSTKIPIFSKIKDKDLVNELNHKLIKSIYDGNTQLAISELEIVGTNEIFNHNDNEYSLKYGHHEKSVSSSLSIDEVKAFCDEFDLDYNSTVLDIFVIVCKEGKSVVTKRIKDYVEYTEDSHKCILSKGEWYKFNDDYLQYLHDSIEEIPVIYDPKYDFNTGIHNTFIEQLYLADKDNPYIQGLNREEALKNSKRSTMLKESLIFFGKTMDLIITIAYATQSTTLSLKPWIYIKMEPCMQ